MIIAESRGQGGGDAGALEARGVRVHFEGVKAVDGVDVTLRRGEILGLIGPNGAGKTTLVNALSGFERPTAGRVALDGADITGWPPHRVARRGLARTFQNVRLYPRLSVLQNVELGAVGTGLGRKEAQRRAWELLERVDMARKAALLAEALPYGDERRLGILRALATRPRYLLLDEPAAGLDETESDELMRAIVAIRADFACGVLVIDHDMRLIMRLCERIQVLDYGRTIGLGSAGEVRANPAVVAAYLGTERGGRRREEEGGPVYARG